MRLENKNAVVYGGGGSMGGAAARGFARGRRASSSPVAPSESDVQTLIDDTLIRRLPRLAEVAGAAVFAASDDAGAMTSAVFNLTCGAIVD